MGDGLRPGFSRADLHVHTTFSDGTATPEDVLNYYAVHGGIQVVAITDHDTLDGALRAKGFKEDHPDIFGHLEVIVAEEVTSRDGHILGLFLEEWVPPGMDAARTVEVIHDQGGIAVAAHPYTNCMRWAGLVGVGDLIRSVAFDAVETRNSNFTEVFANRRAERNAGGKARVGCSDGHFMDAVGRCYTEFPGSTAEDLRRAILERTTLAGGSCYGLPTLARFVLGRLYSGEWVIPKRRRFRREAQAGDLEIAVHTSSGIDAAVLSVKGRLDETGTRELKETLVGLAEARVGMVVDLSGVSFLASAGITALIAGLKASQRRGVGFSLARLSPPVVRTLNATRLRQIFPCEDDVEKARSQVRRQAPTATAPWAPDPETPS